MLVKIYSHLLLLGNIQLLINKQLQLKNSILFLLIISISISGLSTDKKEWEDPTIFNIYRAAPHAYFIPYESERLALDNNKDQSTYYNSLNGTWKFNIASNPASRPADFFKISAIIPVDFSRLIFFRTPTYCLLIL